MLSLLKMAKLTKRFEVSERACYGNGILCGEDDTPTVHLSQGMDGLLPNFRRGGE
jgi:hypothetical protein